MRSTGDAEGLPLIIIIKYILGTFVGYQGENPIAVPQYCLHNVQLVFAQIKMPFGILKASNNLCNNLCFDLLNNITHTFQTNPVSLTYSLIGKHCTIN